MRKKLLIFRDDFLINEMPNWSKTRDLDQCLPVERVTETLTNQIEQIQAENFPNLSEASIMVFKEEETNKVVTERFNPQSPTRMRIPASEEVVLTLPADTNAKRHLAVLHDFLDSIKNENLPELKKGGLIFQNDFKLQLTGLIWWVLNWNNWR